MSSEKRDRFKIGDVIVNIRDTDYDFIKAGESVTVVDCDGDGLPWVDKGEDVHYKCVDDVDFELYEVYNSPLFKALS